MTMEVVESKALLASTTHSESVSRSDVVSYTYNRQSEQLTITDQRGNVRSLYRDVLGRQTNDCVTTITSGTDNSVLQIATAYEIRGMVSTVTSYNNASQGVGTIVNQVQLTFNTFSQLIKEQQSHSGAVSGSTPSVQYGYDDGSANEIRLNTLTYPNGRIITKSYGTSGGMNDYLNRIDTIQDTTSGTTDLASYTYLGSGMAVRITYPQSSIWLDLWGGTSGTFNGLDQFNRITDQRWQNNITGTPADIDRYQYGYDFNSNRLWKGNVVAHAASVYLDEAYSYDNLNRLTEMQRGNLSSGSITGTPVAEDDYTLDATGNWPAYVTKASGTTNLSQTRTSNTVNEITAINASTGTIWATPAYDAAGNTTTMPVPEYPYMHFTAVYDAWNRMVSLNTSSGSVATYGYDGQGRRIVKYTASLSQTRHFYYTSNWQDIEERIGTATTMNLQYVWGVRYVDELVCRDDATPERLYPTQDANFNVTSISNTSGGVVERGLYDPFGDPTIMSGSWVVTGSSPYNWVIGHQGLSHDLESGLVYIRSRYLHAPLGRFMTVDPIGYTDGTTLYAYEHNSPLAARDPLGLYVVCCRPAQGLIDSLVTHCAIWPTTCPSGETTYSVYQDTSPTRTLLNCNSTLPCSQATAADVAACVKKNPYSATPLPPGAGGCSLGGGEWGNNCQTSTLQTLSACCLRTDWQPDIYAGPNAPCLAGHWVTRIAPPIGPGGGSGGSVQAWVCDLTGPDPIDYTPPPYVPPPIDPFGPIRPPGWHPPIDA